MGSGNFAVKSLYKQINYPIYSPLFIRFIGKIISNGFCFRHTQIRVLELEHDEV